MTAKPSTIPTQPSAAAHLVVSEAELTEEALEALRPRIGAAIQIGLELMEVAEERRRARATGKQEHNG